MPKSRECLHAMVKQAIPNPDAGIVNFRALREVLAASIDHPSAGSNQEDTSAADNSSKRNDSTISADKATFRTSANSNSNIKELHRKLDSVVERFDVFSEELLNKMDKLNKRVSKIEAIQSVKKEEEQ